ncbi:MAG: serine hydrolase [Spirochaetaceae bacterium]|jgi:CubicO group peptidase (beta-lactamase class C family)|nr:serine hydrolase [Spirochaetaceae bacterium]
MPNSGNPIINDIFVTKEMERYRVPGLALSVFTEEESLLRKGYGYRDLTKKTPVTPGTQFGIASCSKSFTSMLAAMLDDEGILRFDVPLCEYFPDFRLYDPQATKGCTMRDMLTHLTGIAGHDALWTDTIDRAALWERLRFIEPNAAFRGAVQYSNLIYTMAGHAMEKITGQTWEALIKERIFQALGMKNSNTSVNDMVLKEDYATPYRQSDTLPFPVKPWNVDLGGPAASINSCLTDMELWIRFNMGDGVWQGKRLVSGKNLNLVHQGQVAYRLWRWNYPEADPMGQYAMGWYTNLYRNREIVFHVGEIEGYCSMQAFLPKEKIGFVCLMNLHKPCMLIKNALLYTIIDNLLELPPANWGERLSKETGQYGYMYEHWEVNLLKGEPVQGTAPSHPLKAYAGMYHNPGYGNFEIIAGGKALEGRYRDVKEALVHYHYDTFRVPEIKMDTQLYTLPLTFTTNPYTGDIDGFHIPMEPRVTPIFFRRKDREA